MDPLDDMGFPLLVEGVDGSCACNQLRRPQESILSIATAARTSRTGKATVVVGTTNLRIDCRYRAASDDFAWWADGVQKAAHEVSFLLDDAQQGSSTP